MTSSEKLSLDYRFETERGSREHYDDAVLYDHEYRRRREDVKFYRGLSDRFFGGHSGELLELACGSGRVTRELLRAGHHVVACDMSAPMLTRARARIDKLGKGARARAQLFQADMRSFELSRRFPLVVMAFNAFEHLYDLDSIRQCLRAIRRHLAHDGLLVFDVQNPNPRLLARRSDKRWGRTKFRHPESGEPLHVSTSSYYDREQQIEFIRFYYQRPDQSPEQAHVVRLAQRRFYPQELELLLQDSGFELVLRLGDFDGQTFDKDSPWQILHCRPQK